MTITGFAGDKGKRWGVVQSAPPRVCAIALSLLCMSVAGATAAPVNEAAESSAVSAFEQNVTRDLGEDIKKVNQYMSRALNAGAVEEVSTLARDFRAKVERKYGPESPEAAFVNILFPYTNDPDTLTVLERSVNIIEKKLGPEHPILGIGNFHLGSMYIQKRRDFIRGEERLLRAKRIGEKSREASWEPSVINSMLALAAVMQYKFSEAQSYCEQSIKEAETIGKEEVTVAALIAASAIYERLGQYSRAEAAYLRALDLMKQVSATESPLYIATQLNFARFYVIVGDYERATNLLQGAISKINKVHGEQSETMAMAQHTLLFLCRSQGKLVEAKDAQQKTLEFYVGKYGREHSDVAESLWSDAIIELQQAKYSNAEELCREAIGIWNNCSGKQANSDVAKACNLLGDILLGQNRNEEAAAEYGKALAIEEQLCGDQQPTAAVYLRDLARSQYVLGDAQGAMAHLTRSIAFKTKYLQSVLGMDEKARLAWQAKEMKIDVEACILPDDQIADLILRWKGVVLDSLLEDYTLVGGEGSHEKVRKEVRELKSLKGKLGKYAFADEGNKMDSRELERISNRIAELQRSFAQRVASFGSVRRSAEFSINSLQPVLTGGRVLIDFIRFEDPKLPRDERSCYGALVLGEDCVPSFVRISDAKGIDRAVEGARAAIAANNELAFEENTKVLSEKLWSPIASRIPANSTKLAIAPEGVLNFLSFATLLDPDGKFIAEKFDIAYVGSGRDLVRSGASQRVKTLAVFADPVFDESSTKAQTRELAMRSAEADIFGTINLPPLPGTKEESEVLQVAAKASDWDVQAYLGRDATETRIRSVAKPGILHLATHGFYLNSFTPTQAGERGMQVVAGQTDDEDKAAKNGVDPMRASGVALTGAQATLKSWSRKEAPDPETDGVLTAEEVAGLDLKGTWLVTLSACETGVGEARSGEGVFGLRRAFMMAGAENLLMTLWPVSDETTAKIMADFYKEVLATGDAPGSLAKVQREWLVKLRAERGMLAAVREAGPFAMVMMTNPNSKPTFTKAAFDKVAPPQSPRPNASHGNSKNAGGKSAPPKKTPRSSSSAPESVPVMIYDTKTKKLINSNVYKMQRP